MCKSDDKNKRRFTKQNIKAFIKPLKHKSLRIDRKASGMVAFVGFDSENYMKQMLMKDKSFIGMFINFI